MSKEKEADRERRIVLGKAAFALDRHVMAIVFPERSTRERNRIKLGDLLDMDGNLDYVTDDERIAWNNLKNKWLQDKHWEKKMKLIYEASAQLKNVRLADAHGNNVQDVTKEQLLLYAEVEFKNAQDEYYEKDAKKLIELLASMSNDPCYPLL
ncbi:MAG: hypothetical protein H0U27_00910 [Nitrosopumilus sp.]|nr:hypothetical protein [Nitrosopumilus sp.]